MKKINEFALNEISGAKDKMLHLFETNVDGRNFGLGKKP